MPYLITETLFYVIIPLTAILGRRG